jgi:ABC-type glutathione transport system ATPase component
MSVRGLGIASRHHGIWQATRKIDFDIAPGERVGIVGESGCGKTITGLSILRLLPNISLPDGSDPLRRYRSRQTARGKCARSGPAHCDDLQSR